MNKGVERQVQREVGEGRSSYYERVCTFGKADDIGDTCACVMSSKFEDDDDGLCSVLEPGVFGVFPE